jgi:hypothetical protein
MKRHGDLHQPGIDSRIEVSGPLEGKVRRTVAEVHAHILSNTTGIEFEALLKSIEIDTNGVLHRGGVVNSARGSNMSPT